MVCVMGWLWEDRREGFVLFIWIYPRVIQILVYKKRIHVWNCEVIGWCGEELKVEEETKWQ